jgi:chloramphenicol 3-O phosphotransferase
MSKAKLIILNGGSSSGKSTLAEHFQNMNNEPYVRLGIDRFWLAIPPKELVLEKAHPDYYSIKIFYKNDLPYFDIIPGPVLDKVMYASYECINCYLKAGVNVISDQLFWKKDWLKGILKSINDEHLIYWIGVYISDEQGAKREAQRGDRSSKDKDTAANTRHEGWNRRTSELTHNGMLYDFELDTSFDTPDTLAKKMKKFIDSNANPTANKKLKEKWLR